MASISPLSGYPEWLPGVRLLEQQIVQLCRTQFERFGFVPIEVRAVEPLSVLLQKGDDKEIYLLQRLQETDFGSKLDQATLTDQKEVKHEKTAEDILGLHFDLTVPFARYVQEFEHQLVFPFKRYQIQKVWRGERKQEGRYREFYQCDIDVVAKGTLPLAMDAELIMVFRCLFAQLNNLIPKLPKLILRVNHRKILQGCYQSLAISCVAKTMRVVDKLKKIGEDAVREQLLELGLSAEAVAKCLQLAQIKGKDLEVVAKLQQLGVDHPLFEEGVSELTEFLTWIRQWSQTDEQLSALNKTSEIVVDCSIVRGLDYYTGMVFEGYLAEHEAVGAVCSGGRYANLIQSKKQALPGVGASLGLTRLLGYLSGREMLPEISATTVLVQVILPDEAARNEAFKVAQQLRQRGINADIYHQPQNFGKQMKAAQKKGIPYVWFLGNPHQVKELATGMQQEADPESWQPGTPREPISNKECANVIDDEQALRKC